MRKLLAVTVLVLMVVPAVAQEGLPSFEVVSVKVNRSTAEGQSMRLQPGVAPPSRTRPCGP